MELMLLLPLFLMALIVVTGKKRQRGKKYGFLRFVFDAVMVYLTCGFWLIYMLYRENRVRR